MVISALSYAFTHFKIRAKSTESIKQVSRAEQHKNNLYRMTSSNAKRSFQLTNSQKKQNLHSSSFADLGHDRLQQEESHFFLVLYLINQSNLKYFQRKKQEKLMGKNFTLEHYQRFQITYEKPKSQKLIKFADKKTSYSNFNKHKMLKIKNKQSSSPQKQTKNKFQFIGKIVLTEKITNYFAFEHSTQKLPIVHLARSNQMELLSFTLQLNRQQQEDIISTLNFHVNYKEILNLKAMKNNQFTLQLFFQPYQEINQCSFQIGQIFLKLCGLYDFLKKIKPQQVFHTQMLTYCQASKQIKFKQFRYKFLANPQEYLRQAKLIYEQYFQQQQEQKLEEYYFRQKYYTIGVVMYELVFGRCLFDLETVQQIFLSKVNLKNVPFPKYSQINTQELFKDFINRCITLKFQNQVQLLKHHWIQSFAELK